MKKLLFVDDETRILDGLRRMLRGQREEWDCYFASGVDEALLIVESEPLDAIVSDMNMPGRTGMDFLRIVRSSERTRYWPFLMLTGNGESGLKQEALDAGVTDFLAKPCDFVELVARLRNAVALKEFQDEVRRQNLQLEERVAERTEELEHSRRDLIFRLAKAAETRDCETGNHIIRVGFFSQILAEALGLDEIAQERILLTSPLHDVGKIGIADEILRKPGPLNPNERSVMQRHCHIGAQILTEDLGTMFGHLAKRDNDPNPNELLPMAARIALCHHEKWDGSGYPQGLVGEEIPLEARIVAVADVYDALRSRRPYKDEITAERALEIMNEGSGSHFDPSIIAVLVDNIQRIEETLAALRENELTDLMAA